MKKYEMHVTIIVFVLAACAMILFLSKVSTRGGQDYFEGIVLENTNSCIVVQIDTSYEKLIRALGETVKIEKKDVVQESDFSEYPLNESVRVIYSGINAREKSVEHTFAIYALSKLP